jgi:hypothetical protein
MSGNPWVEKSRAVALEPSYLDRLSEVYSLPEPVPRPLSSEQRGRVVEAFERDDATLLGTLLGLFPKGGFRFPYREPYIGFLRFNPGAMEENPRTVARICARIRAMGSDGAVRSLEVPKESNRQMGPMFKNWLRGRFRTLSQDDLLRSTEGIALLDGNDKELMDFANVRLNCGLTKRPDLVARVNDRYVVGEAKYIGYTGGNQDKSFRDALSLALKPTKATMVAILDGIVWLPTSGHMWSELAHFTGNAVSSLLLSDFLDSL